MIATTAPFAARGIDAAVLDYLRRRLQRPDLRFHLAPTSVPNGWETNTFRLQLEGARPLPPRFAAPLALRAYSSACGLPRLRHEFEVQKHLARRGYPVPAPLLMEEDARLLGGPFLLMEWIPGQTLLEFLLTHPTSIWGHPAAMAELHCRLHTLPLEDFPAPPGPFLPRSLEQLADTLQTCGLDGMVPGLEWLQAQQPPPPTAPCIVHLDFHPLNLLIHDGAFRAVLDWNDADVGDYHADVAATLVLIDTAPVKLSSWWHWLISFPGQGMLRRRYLRAYRRRLPIDARKLRYYRAWAAFRRLAIWESWLHAGPEATGIKPSTIQRLTPERLGFLARYFEKWSGVPLRLRPVSTGSSLALA